jgi:dipeptidyl aminopeptidase/acylaminoacyl peptidase
LDGQLFPRSACVDRLLTAYSQTYVFLNEDTIVAAPVQNGKYQLVYIDLETQDWATLNVPLVEHRMDCLAPLSATAFLAIGSGYTTPRGVYDIEILEDLETEITLVRSSVDDQLPEAIFSTPVPIRFTTLKAPQREVHGFFWPPHNPRYVAPEGELPPLIVASHGGPTGHTPPGLQMRHQYFTSRGYAYFAINYTGSSGHGKAYRKALFGQWGILDRDDVAEAVEYLTWTGRIDRQRVGIEGGSAGGYNTLCALTWYPSFFAGGLSMCGVSAIQNLAEKTHKLESHYVEVLLDLKGKSPEEKNALFASRSPLYHAENITSPLLLVHGDEDVVVPIEQSKEIRRKIRERGGDAELIVLKGEGHMFQRAESWETIVVEAEKWWRKTLLKRSE